MGTTASFFINSPASGTQYWATMATGLILAAGDSVTAHCKAWSGANGTGSGVTVSTLETWVWDQTTNASVGHFSANSVISVTASRTGGSNNDLLKVSGKFTGVQSVGSLEIWFTYTSSALFIPTQPSFSPSAGGVGTSVTLTGTHFTDATTVTLNGASCSFSVTNDTTIVATVPSGATTGPFLVGNTNGNSPNSASNFLVANGYIYRTGVWTPGVVDAERSSVQTTAQGVFVYRTGVWTPSQ